MLLIMMHMHNHSGVILSDFLGFSGLHLLCIYKYTICMHHCFFREIRVWVSMSLQI